MRLCILTREYRPVTSYSGGVGTLYGVLAPELVRQGHAVHVVTIAQQGIRNVEREGVQLHLRPIPRPRRLWPLVEAAWTLVADRTVRALGRFDLVLAAEWGGDARAYAQHRRSGPLVTHLHTSLAQILQISPRRYRSLGQRVRDSIQPPLERGQAERSDFIIAVSRAVLDWARELWNIESVPSTILPNMVDLERVRSLAEGEPPTAFPEVGPIVAFSGRLEVRKGVHVLAEAMQSVWREFPNARLVMLGADSRWRRGRMSEHVLRLADGFRDRVHLLGDQPPQRLFPALARADLVALPSLWEAFPLAALEAMAVRRPLVVTSGAGFEDFIRNGHEGLIVPPGDVASLASAIVELLADGALRQRLGSAAAAAAENHSPSVVTKRYVECFGRLAQGA